jgi:hypothetical protein
MKTWNKTSRFLIELDNILSRLNLFDSVRIFNNLIDLDKFNLNQIKLILRKIELIKWYNNLNYFLI